MVQIATCSRHDLAHALQNAKSSHNTSLIPLKL
jgi:hypothetical protein